jgi:hypothetical protein
MVDPLPRTLQHGGIVAVAAWLVLLNMVDPQAPPRPRGIR